MGASGGGGARRRAGVSLGVRATRSPPAPPPLRRPRRAWRARARARRCLPGACARRVSFLSLCRRGRSPRGSAARARFVGLVLLVCALLAPLGAGAIFFCVCVRLARPLWAARPCRRAGVGARTPRHSGAAVVALSTARRAVGRVPRRGDGPPAGRRGGARQGRCWASTGRTGQHLRGRGWDGIWGAGGPTASTTCAPR